MPQADGCDAVFVGHLCLDLLPAFLRGGKSIAEVLIPGKLIDIGGMTISNGGSANNTGQAMHRLGFDVRIVGKLGDDFIGKAILDNIAYVGERAVRHMVVEPGATSSFTVILNPPGIDRVFLHSAATNDTFVSGDIDDAALAGAKVLHFGYPPLLADFYKNDGAETKKLFTRAKALGLTVSLDMARPDPETASGRVNWRRYLEEVLPLVDLFLPSADEMFYMLHRDKFDHALAAAEGGNLLAFVDMESISAMADEVLALGPAVVGFKLGDQGFYLKTSSDPERLASMGPLSPADIEPWVGREMAAPCFRVEVAGTTGAGDATIAGFIGAMVKGLEPEDAVIMAVGTGASGVEALDAASAIRDWDRTAARFASGWPQREIAIVPGDWKRTDKGVFQKPCAM